MIITHSLTARNTLYAGTKINFLDFRCSQWYLYHDLLDFDTACFGR